MKNNPIRIVQVNEKCFIVQERGRFWGWNTWKNYSIDFAWEANYSSIDEAQEAIHDRLEDRKKREDAKNFHRKVVWP